MTRTFALALFAVLAAPALAPAEDAPKPKSPAEPLQGTWLFDAAALKKRSELGRVWESVVTVKGDAFALSQLMGSKNDLKGTLVFDPANPQAVDLKIAELDLSELLPDYKVPAGTLPAIYKFDGDRLTLCFPTDYKGKRPAAFAASADAYLVTLVRAPTEFKGWPKEVKVTVVGADGKPVAGASVCQHMAHRDGEDRTKPAEWEDVRAVKCGADGTVTISTKELVFGQLIACGPANDTMAVVHLTPANLVAGVFRLELRPRVRITGTVVCEELAKAGQPIGWTGVDICRDGNTIAYFTSKDGKFELFAPPGKYTIGARGAQAGSRSIEITVPDNQSEYAVAPINLPALAFALLKGKPAPELAGVVAWKGDKTTFAALKGKYVLIEFWGYWCGPCIGSMPVLIELHEKFADKGLAIVGVHMDIDGDVDTAAKLDAKIAGYKKEHWKGKELPFPNALVSGVRIGTGDDAKRGGPIAQYGVQGYPTCILIDREGKVVGQFHARDIKSASAEIEKLLSLKK